MRPTEPDFAIEPGKRALRAQGRVPADLPVLDGHFPGHPIVPGFAQVEWARLLAARHLGATAPLGQLAGLKFPTPLLPGATVSVELEAQADGFKFQLLVGSEVTCMGRARQDRALGRHDPQESTSPDVPGSHALRLPHAGPMRLLATVVDHDATTTTCLAQLGPNTPFAAADRTAPACLAIELMAQAMAAHGGLGADAAASPRRGFLVAGRQVSFRTAALRVGETLWARADHVRGETGMVAFRCALGGGAIPASEEEALARALVHGSLGAFVEPDV